MKMRIDSNKLPVKYSLEVYKMVEGYPSTIDLLYEVVRLLEERDKLHTVFSANSMLKEVSVRIEGEDLQTTLKRLVKEGWLEEDPGGFRLVKHPWMSETK